jgi:hypothetical protein
MMLIKKVKTTIPMVVSMAFADEKVVVFVVVDVGDVWSFYDNNLVDNRVNLVPSLDNESYWYYWQVHGQHDYIQDHCVMLWHTYNN